jgi:hypothetical protein
VERFEEWVRFVFDHPALAREVQLRAPAGVRDWYWDAEDEIESWTAQPTLTVQRMTRLFEHPESLAPYSRDQVAQGIWFLVGESSPGKFAYELFNSSVEIGVRLVCIRTIPSFFASFVAVHCARPTLGNEETLCTRSRNHRLAASAERMVAGARALRA